MTTKKATKKQKEAHEFVLSLSVQELLRILPADLKPAQLRKQDAQVNQVIAKPRLRHDDALDGRELVCGPRQHQDSNLGSV